MKNAVVAGYYFTGDGAYRDQDGYIWITGRVDGACVFVCFSNSMKAYKSSKSILQMF